MTINNTANKVVAAGNGVMTVFNFLFVGDEPSDIAVIFTDAGGNETVLASSQYSLLLNAAAPGQIWGIGGTVTYPLSGSPIALGTTLTIIRTLPLLQQVALGNQGNEFPSAVETALDTLTMEIQQVNEIFQRAIVVPVVDPTPPLPLPPAAQRANQALVFDANGNPVAGAIPASGIISTAMQPVVNAATLAVGRAAFGLGSAAVENIGSYGLIDDGTGNLLQVLKIVQDSTNQAITSAFHLNQRIGTGPIIYSLPPASSLFNGFGFWLTAVSGDLVVTPNAGDSFRSLASGTSIAVPQGSTAFITTDAGSPGTWYATYNSENVHIAAGVSGNALTISINATSLKFRDPTLANGDVLAQAIPANMSIVVPNGATLGTTNGVASRIWLFACRNAGAPVLGVANATGFVAPAAVILPIASWETNGVAGTLISTAADAAGVLYTATAFGGDSVRMIGYVEFANGQVTAGAWASAPTTIQVLDPSVKKPGDVIQISGASITPRSAANLIEVSVNATWEPQTTTSSSAVLKRGAVTIQNTTITAPSNTAFVPVVFASAIDQPNSIAALTYTVAVGSGVGSTSSTTTKEIMG